MSRVIAFYLPQYYPIAENNDWWGPGFTEWINVVKAKKLFPGHYQPHIPADLGFYDLRLGETRIAQAAMAKRYGIEGFCYWHYWFGNGKRLLERPFNEVVASGEPNYPFCIGWANHSWERKTWDKRGSSEILIRQEYPGEQDFIDHFNALLPAFKDKRYIKVNNKLLFVIFNPADSESISKFIKCWRELAKQHKLVDFFFVAKDADSRSKEKSISIGFDAIYNDDVFNIHHHLNTIKKVWHYALRNILGIPTVFQYKKAIKYMVSADCRNNNVIPMIAPNWDHSPRSGGKAIILHKSKPEYFKMVVKNALDIIKHKPVELQLIFIKSWNEWGEGNYLEPDIMHGIKYLQAFKEAMIENGFSSIFEKVTRE